jgi:DNA-binding FrmR family transcriptional regulator
MKDLWSRMLAAWDNLSVRERMLLSIMGATALVFLLALAVVNPLLGVLDRGSQRIDGAEQQLQAMVRLQRDYREVHGQLESIEEKIRGNKERRNVLTQLEALAASADVKVDAMQERQAANNEKYRETRVEVALKSVTLAQTTEYLHSIETSERLFAVKSMRIRTRTDGSDLLDVSFTVSSFEPI